MTKTIAFFLTNITILFILTSCETTEITYLYHKDTYSVGVPVEEINFSDVKLKKYTINEILFYPVIRHNSSNSNPETYSLALKVFKPKEVTDNSVIINNVKLEGSKAITFKPISTEINKNIEFINDGNQLGVKTSENDLIDEINDYDMNLKDNKSELKVLINVSVISGKQIITKELEYIFKAETEEYSTFLQ
ncbi:hypothetical protein [Bacillus suaedaesalsae]|uniref:Lipoprotein n=1 Tax=Bacillus suaedaesalsae TaxID=2810349 RepID=A0ABS2DCY7_9BACI|nr:hypothetical protein [Bacillus suaedaesalsae]MBM6616326.1 hypothetical protein [Bacillus suaedaesalsae]